MNDEDKKKQEIEEKGHPASEDELMPEEAAEGAEENEGPSVEELPEVVDHFVEENEFPSAPSDRQGD